MRAPAPLTAVAALLACALVTAVPSAASSCERPLVGPDAGRSACMKAVGSLEVSETGGLGQIEVHGKTGAVLQRDEGIVALLDLKNPSTPKVVGRYDDGAEDSYDGDLAFSKDGQWLFYARQTHQFSKDGIHVLDLSDPTAPALTDYEPQGGTLRIAYYSSGDEEYVVSLDATHGLVVNRFVRPTGTLVPVNVDALPALKVGGPASAGLAIDPKGPDGTPTLYVTTGRTGLQVFDFSNPVQPVLLGAWDEQGLADVEVVRKGKSRIVYSATEYWFEKSTKPEIVVLDASEPGSMKLVTRLSLSAPPDDRSRIQGIEVVRNVVYAAHSTWGLLGLNAGSTVLGTFRDSAPANESSGVMGTPYAMDVEWANGLLLLSDASTGVLTVLRPAR